MTIRIELPLLEVVAVGNRRGNRGKIIRNLRDGDRIDDYQAMSWIVSTLAPLINLSTGSTASIQNDSRCYNMQNNQCNRYVTDVCNAHNWNMNGVTIRRPNKRRTTVKVFTNR